MLHPTEVGQRVMYARDWLRDTGQLTGVDAPASWGPFAAGEAIAFEPLSGGRSFVMVRWDNGEEHATLNLNLVREDKLHLERA